MLGIAQARVPTARPARIEVRLEPDDAQRAARFRIEATLTVVLDEGTDKERILLLPVRVEKPDQVTLRFAIQNGSVTAEVER